MKKIVEERKDIAFYIKMTALQSHPAAYEKAKAIICAKSPQLLEDAYENKPLPKPTCETAVVDENRKLLGKLGNPGLPFLILPDGRGIRGYRDAKTLIDLIGK